MSVEYRDYEITIAYISCDWPDCMEKLNYRGGLNQTGPFKGGVRLTKRWKGWGNDQDYGDLCPRHLQEASGQLTIEGAISADHA